jgi:hypothetical protein
MLFVTFKMWGGISYIKEIADIYIYIILSF